MPAVIDWMKGWEKREGEREREDRETEGVQRRKMGGERDSVADKKEM